MSKGAKINGILILFLALLVGASSYWVKHRHTTTHTPASATLVQLSKPHEVLLPHLISTTGNLEAIEQTNISSKIAGYVTKINYQEGHALNKGSLLIQLDDRKELAAVDSAKAQQHISSLKYEQLKKMYRARLVAYDEYIQAKTNNEKDDAALETTETDLADKSIHAPFSGTAGAKQISVGDFIQPGTPFLTLTNLNKLRVTYSVPTTDLNAIQLGQPVTITSPTLTNEQFNAVVAYIAPTIDTQSQTITVHAIVDNAQKKLKPGLFVTISQTLSSPNQATVIPSSALFASLNGYYVLGVKNNKAYKIPVTVGRKLQNDVIITSGLTLNDQFINQGQQKVQPGQAVKVSTR